MLIPGDGGGGGGGNIATPGQPLNGSNSTFPDMTSLLEKGTGDEILT